MRKFIVLLLPLILLTSCIHSAQRVETVDGLQIELLFRHKGCNIYRAYDAGAYFYWANCSGQDTIQSDDFQITITKN